MNNKYIMVDMEDEKLASLADVLSNKTSKKILSYLVDKDANETEIARDLKIPANTINYNIKKLLESGLVEKSRKFLWSVKGRKISYYKISNKKIVISPKTSSNLKSVLSAFLITGIGAMLIKLYLGWKEVAQTSVEKTFDSAISVASSEAMIGSSGIIQTSQSFEPWIWFLLGGLASLIIYMILNYRRLN